MKLLILCMCVCTLHVDSCWNDEKRIAVYAAQRSSITDLIWVSSVTAISAVSSFAPLYLCVCYLYDKKETKNIKRYRYRWCTFAKKDRINRIQFGCFSVQCTDKRINYCNNFQQHKFLENLKIEKNVSIDFRTYLDYLDLNFYWVFFKTLVIYQHLSLIYLFLINVK